MTSRLRRTAPVAGALLCALAMAACASHPKPMGPAATRTPTYAPAPGESPQSSEESPPVSERNLGPAPGSTQDFVIHAGDRVYFGYNQYTVGDEAHAVLDAQAAWLQRYPEVRVRVEGNCDDRGTTDYNFALGARRAQAVKDYLAQHGVSAARIETVSYGKERPIAFGQSEDDYGKNRNAHTAITSGSRS